MDLGVRSFRIELLKETPEVARRLISSHRNLLDGKEIGETLWKELRASSYMGVTRGPLGREE
jgi:putative protease